MILTNLGNKVNAMYFAYATKLGLCTKKIGINV